MHYEHSKTVGIILAGGAGRRLGGLDKGLQIYQAKRLIDHVIERLEPQVDDLLICANRNISDYQTLGFDVVRDENEQHQGPTFQGPMAGISAALSHLEKSEFQAAVVVSCDVPKLPPNLIEKLRFGGDHPVAVAHDGERKQNLHCLIQRCAWSSLIESFQSGERAMHRWFNTIGIDEVDFSDQAECFLNINSADLLAKK